jgi:hypothetical protein
MNEFFYGKPAFVVVAAVGGVAKHLSEYLRGAKFNWRILLANVFVSAFSGYVFAEVFIQLMPNWSYAAAGIGGYMGSQALDFAVGLMKEKVNAKVKI